MNSAWVAPPRAKQNAKFCGGLVVVVDGLIHGIGAGLAGAQRPVAAPMWLGSPASCAWW